MCNRYVSLGIRDSDLRSVCSRVLQFNAAWAIFAFLSFASLHDDLPPCTTPVFSLQYFVHHGLYRIYVYVLLFKNKCVCIAVVYRCTYSAPSNTKTIIRQHLPQLLREIIGTSDHKKNERKSIMSEKRGQLSGNIVHRCFLQNTTHLENVSRWTRHNNMIRWVQPEALDHQRRKTWRFYDWFRRQIWQVMEYKLTKNYIAIMNHSPGLYTGWAVRRLQDRWFHLPILRP